MKLYEISAEYERFMREVEAGDIPEDCIEDTLEGIVGELEDKADNIACIIKDIDSDITAIATEKARLAAREKVLKNRADRLSRYLSDALLRADMREVNTARNRITFRKSEGVIIEDAAAFVAWATENRDDLLRYEQPKPDAAAIKEAIQHGAAIPGAAVEVRHNIQIK